MILLHPFRVAGRMDRDGEAMAGEQIIDLADPHGRDARRMEKIEERGPGGCQRKISPVDGPGIRAARPYKGARDHASHSVAAGADLLPRRPAYLIEPSSGVTSSWAAI